MKNQIKADCLFCKIINQEVPSDVVYENEHVLAFLDVNPNSNGHTLVIPKAHFENYSECADEYLTQVALAKKLIVNRILTSDLKPVGINYTSNQGSEAYQVIMHYHEHIIPKYQKGEGYVIANKTNHDTLKPNKEVLELIKVN